MKLLSRIGITSYLALLSTFAFATSDVLAGYWYTDNNDSIVQITKTEGKFAGKILWLKDPRYEKGDKNAGKLKKDRENPDKKKRKRPIVGLSILKGFSYKSSSKKWTGGLIYDPEKGKEYKCEINFETYKKAATGKRLHVRGYIGIPTLGRTTYWYRTPEKDLKKFELIEPKEKE